MLGLEVYLVAALTDKGLVMLMPPPLRLPAAIALAIIVGFPATSTDIFQMRLSKHMNHTSTHLKGYHCLCKSPAKKTREL
jgi:hypothetical protein